MGKQIAYQMQHQEFMSGQIVASLLNLFRDPKKRPDPFRPQDFMPSLAGKAGRKRQTLDEQLALINTWAGGANSGQEERGQDSLDSAGPQVDAR